MAKKTSNTAERIKKQQTKLLGHLSESGNISHACKRTGISRETYYCWRGKDDDFASKASGATVKGKEFVNDLAHNKLMQSIQEGHFPAIRFQLASCHDDYLPKKSIQPFRVEDIPLLDIRSIPAMVELEKYRESLGKDSDKE